MKEQFFELGDLNDKNFLDALFYKYKNIDGVINFAAYSLVGESVEEPLKYFQNNVGGTISLLELMKKHNINNIVFSSTAATYGEPESIPIKETNKTEPTNPYGESKLMVEKVLKWAANAYGLKSMLFLDTLMLQEHNAGGEIGEAREVETHIVPLVLEVALGKREKIFIFGDDYDTADGTCMRLYSCYGFSRCSYLSSK